MSVPPQFTPSVSFESTDSINVAGISANLLALTTSSGTSSAGATVTGKHPRLPAHHHRVRLRGRPRQGPVR